MSLGSHSSPPETIRTGEHSCSAEAANHERHPCSEVVSSRTEISSSAISALSFLSLAPVGSLPYTGSAHEAVSTLQAARASRDSGRHHVFRAAVCDSIQRSAAWFQWPAALNEYSTGEESAHKAPRTEPRMLPRRGVNTC